MSNGEPVAHIFDDKEMAAEVMRDGLENLIANLGTENDKRTQSRFVNRKMLSMTGMREELDAMYRTDWISGKVVDIVPNDMTREWRKFDGEITPDQMTELEEEENRLALQAKFNEAHKWARLYGTAFIVMSVDDGQDPSMPLNIDSIKRGGLRHVQVVDKNRLKFLGNVDDNPLSSTFGMPLMYRSTGGTAVDIHHTRVLRFDGVNLPFDQFKRQEYTSDSVLDRLYDTITNFDTTVDGSASMVYETNVDIVKVKGLMNYLQTAEGEELLRKRFSLAKLLKSFNNLMLLDSEETLDTKQNTFSGLPDLIDRFGQIIAAGSDIPATRMLGESSPGFQSTGDGELKNYYDRLKSEQMFMYKPKLDYFDIIMAKSLGLPDDSDLSYEFNSLFQLTEQEQATLELTRAQRDDIYLNWGVVTEEIVAKELAQEGTYTNIDDHIEELEELEESPDASDPENVEPDERPESEDPDDASDDDEEGEEDSEE